MRVAHDAPERPFLDRYWNESRRPLNILAFLLPLIVAYEIGLFLLLPDHRALLTNLAHETVMRFFAVFGVHLGLSLPAIVLVIVLLAWQVLSRDRWRIDPPTLFGMGLESILLVVPLLVIGQVIARSLPALMPVAGPDDLAQLAQLARVPDVAQAMQPAAIDRHIGDLSLLDRITVSLGAGIYEELVFRMLLVAVLAALLVDVGRASTGVGSTVAVVVAAAVFTWYHPLVNDDGALSIQRVAFYFIAGLYFGAIFVVRGFGVAAAVHAFYDIAVAVFLLPRHA